jgi:hypothetical protein
MEYRYFALLFGLLLVTGCTPPVKCNENNPNTCLRILFIGNSYTYENNLPDVLSHLAESGGHFLETGISAKGGLTLQEHEKDPNTGKIIAGEKWNYVVLQEQSEIPAVSASREASMYPAVRALVRLIRNNHAIPLLFETWGHKDGAKEFGIPDYPTMQSDLLLGYAAIAAELNVPVSPVGLVWMKVRERYPDLELWQSDGSHPNHNGTYLAACVFYAVLYRESPVGLAYTSLVPSGTAEKIRKIVAEIVIGK